MLDALLNYEIIFRHNFRSCYAIVTDNNDKFADCFPFYFRLLV